MAVGCRMIGRFAAMLLATAVGTSAATATARAAASPWFQTEQGGVRLVAAADGVGDQRTLSLGIEFRMKPGWKIYWRSPGDAGFPPQLDWKGSKNLKGAEVHWPAPERFTVLGLETLGYHDRVVLPVAAESAAPGEPVDLKVQVRYLTCENLCIPYDTTLSLALPEGPGGPSPEAAEIARFAAEVPGPGGAAGLDVTDASLSTPVETGDRRVLRVVVASATPFTKPDLFVEGPPGYSYSAPSVSFAPDRRRAVMRVSVAPPPKDPPPIAGKALTFTLVDGARAIEARRAPAVATDAADAPEREMAGGFLAALALALLGGLILNLMPCVLPVLSIKLLSVVGHAGGAARDVRRGFIASAAGIVLVLPRAWQRRRRVAAGRHGGAVGYPVPAACLPRRHGADRHAVRRQSVGTVRYPSAGLRRRSGGDRRPSARACRTFLRRRARDPAGDTLHRALPRDRGRVRALARAGADLRDLLRAGPRACPALPPGCRLSASLRHACRIPDTG